MTITEPSPEARRLERILEDACVKLSVVARDILKVSGGALIQALMDGERDPRWPTLDCA
jgi:transposase